MQYSGGMYLAAMARPLSDQPVEPDMATSSQAKIDAGAGLAVVKLHVAWDVAKCEHGVKICPSRECIDSWSIDYQILFPRTLAGRKFLDIVPGLDPWRHRAPDAETFYQNAIRA